MPPSHYPDRAANFSTASQPYPTQVQAATARARDGPLFPRPLTARASFAENDGRAGLGAAAAHGAPTPYNLCGLPSPFHGATGVFEVHGVPVDDTFAEAFTMSAARLLITADTAAWAETAARSATGYGTSVIGCDAEAGVEGALGPGETPDGRPGVSALVFAFGREALERAVANRVGQCVLTCATTACFDGLPSDREKSIRVGGRLRHFGDGFQSSKVLDGRRYWRVPVMDGEFLCEDRFGVRSAVAGGNLLVMGTTRQAALAAAEAAAAAAREVPGVILPFPCGVIRSGSKVGSRYKGLKASTNAAYCPALRGLVPSALPEGVNAVYEIVIDGLTVQAVEDAMRRAVVAACRARAAWISAANFGGTLGRHQIHLRRLLAEAAD